MRFERGRPAFVLSIGRPNAANRDISMKFNHYLLGLSQDGCTTIELAKYFEMSQSAISRRILCALNPKRRQMTREQYDDKAWKLMTIYERGGVTQMDLAGKHNLSLTMVQRMISDAKLVRKKMSA